jgi:nucleoside-diphosphate-sugar epimerase
MAVNALNIFITGASGFVGGAAARRLSAEGHRIRAMSRSSSSDQKIRAIGAEPVRCDLDAVIAADLRGAEIVIHCAAFVEQWGSSGRLGSHQRPGHPAHARRHPNRPAPGASSTSARRPPWSTANICAVSMRRLRRPSTAPTRTAGPGLWRNRPCATTTARDLRPSSSGPAVSGSGRSDHLPLLKEMVDAIELALTKGQPGEAYFILDEGERSRKAMPLGLAASVGVVLPDRSIPYWLADTIAAVSEGVWRLFRLFGEPPLTRHAAMVMTRDCILIGTKAKNELGYRPRVTVEDGLADLRDGTER